MKKPIKASYIIDRPFVSENKQFIQIQLKSQLTKCCFSFRPNATFRLLI